MDDTKDPNLKNQNVPNSGNVPKKMQYSMISWRSKEFYVIITIIMLICFIYFSKKDSEMVLKLHHEINDIEEHRKQLEKHLKTKHLYENLKTGIIRGAITGYVLGGAEAIMPTTLLLTFFNIISLTVADFIV